MESVPNPVIDEAERALRCFEGEPLDRETAERMLSMWTRREELSDDDWAEVINRFPVYVTLRPPLMDQDDETVEQLRRLDMKVAAMPKVYELGIAEGLRRAKAAIDDVKHDGYAKGFVDALSMLIHGDEPNFPVA